MSAPLLEMRQITKRFPGVLALDGVDFELRAGEVHVLVGENGAGKSTLIKVLAGAVQRDAGDILIDGRPVDIPNPRAAQTLGISVIHQELQLIPYLSVAENIFLGREPTVLPGVLANGVARRRTAELLAHLGMAIDPAARVGRLGIAAQQMVEIAKALSWNARIIVFDEPTAVLGGHEVEILFDRIRQLRAQGLGIIYISHRLAELTQIGDRLTVMRDGRRIATRDVRSITTPEIIQLMVGRDVTEQFPRESVTPGRTAIDVRGLSRRGRLHDISFDVREGEIVGIVGLVGAGRTELARAIFGADPFDHGEILVFGRPVRIRSPQDAVRAGIGLLTEDRKAQGLVLPMSVAANITLANLRAIARWKKLRLGVERSVAEQYIHSLRIRTPSPRQLVRNLSGGNQQKVVIAKWLFTGAKILIFDEPTRGIDVGAKVEVYQLMNRLTREGAAVIMISSEMPEVLGMSDRILVMHAGRITGRFGRGEATQQDILRCAIGEAQREPAGHPG